MCCTRAFCHFLLTILKGEQHLTVPGFFREKQSVDDSGPINLDLPYIAFEVIHVRVGSAELFDLLHRGCDACGVNVGQTRVVQEVPDGFTP